MTALAALALLVVGMALGVAVTLIAYHQGRQAGPR